MKLVLAIIRPEKAQPVETALIESAVLPLSACWEEVNDTHKNRRRRTRSPLEQSLPIEMNDEESSE
jgi:nitrogen regulatory protein PII